MTKRYLDENPAARKDNIRRYRKR